VTRRASKPRIGSGLKPPNSGGALTKHVLRAERSPLAKAIIGPHRQMSRPATGIGGDRVVHPAVLDCTCWSTFSSFASFTVRPDRWITADFSDGE
jgi:hypothetical protein